MISNRNDADVSDKAKSLSLMVAMSVAAGDLKAAEGYLLELMAWVAFGCRAEQSS